jgi:hypothetical protein
MFLQKFYTYEKETILDMTKPSEIDQKTVDIVFHIFALFLVFFQWFSLYSNITNILFWWSALDIFKKDLQTLSIYFLPIDKEISRELSTLNSIV